MSASQAQLPIGTTFELIAKGSKSLQAVRIVSDQFELSGERDSSRTMLREERSATNTGGGPLLSSDGRTISTRMVIVPTAAPLDPHHSPEPAESGAAPPAPDVLQIPASTNLRFFLHDED